MKLSLALHDFYQCWWNPCACAKRQTLSETFCMQVYQWRRQRILIRSRACQREGGTMEKWGWLVVEGVQALFPCEQFTAVPRGAREQWPTLGGGRRSPKRRVKVDICGRARGCSAWIIGSSIILHYCTKGSNKIPDGTTCCNIFNFGRLHTQTRSTNMQLRHFSHFSFLEMLCYLVGFHPLNNPGFLNCSRCVQISLVLNAKHCALKCTTFQNPIRNENAVWK
jgi:hypothetical protein